MKMSFCKLPFIKTNKTFRSVAKPFYLSALAASMLAFVSVAYARTYNYEDVPIGERSFGMGHACMAISGDISNMFYNPATLAYNESSQVSAALSAYARIDTRTGEYVSLFRSARENISRGGFLAIPSTVGGNLKWGDWQWGGSILVPYLFDNSGTVKINASSEAHFQSKYEAVWMGIFAARKFNRHNVGVSLFYASHERDEQFGFYTDNAGTSSIRIVKNNALATGMLAVLGGTYDVSSMVKVGYSLRLPPFVLGGTGERSDIISGGAVNPTEQFKTRFLPIPGRASAGVSWQFNDKLLLAADLHFYFPVKGNSDPAGSETFAVDAKAITNIMLGLEYFHWKDIGIRFGLYSNMSAARAVPLRLTSLDDKVHMFGGTSALVFDKPNGSISLGGYILGGQGSSPTLDQSPVRTRRSNYIYGFVVGSTYKF